MIKLLNNTAQFEIVSQFDDALVREEGSDKAYVKYMDTLKLEDLKLSGDPTLFVVRCLTVQEQAELQHKHVEVTLVDGKPTPIYKNGMDSYAIACFEAACLGIKNTDGSLLKVTASEVGFRHAVAIGSQILYMTSVSKNAKNV